MRFALSLAALLLALATLGCAPGASSSSTGSQQLNATNDPPPPFLNQIPDAPFAVAYSGRRHVKISYAVDGVSELLDYTELVYSDGHGAFLIVPDAVVSPPMTEQQSQLFAQLQKNRDGLFFRYRDFRIRDLPLFVANYGLEDTGQQHTIAGRECEQIKVQRFTDAESSYIADVDPETGLVMRYRETTTTDGLVVAEVEFTDFALNPDLSEVEVHMEKLLSTPLDLQSGTVEQLGFQVLVPKVIPSGYRMQKADDVFDGENHWSRLTYGDGVEQIFLLQSTTSIAQTQSGTLPSSAKVVNVSRIGPFTVVQGSLVTAQIVVLGKISESAALQMLQSALD